jgi:opacity protein-like surface antigen
MKRLLLFLILSLTFMEAAHAAPCYGTNMPERRKFSAMFESYTIFKRYLRENFGNVKSQQEFFGLSYGVFDWLAIDLKAGAGDIRQYPVNADKISYESSFAGGYGLRAKLLDMNKTKVVFGFQHISVHPYSTHVGDLKHKAILDDWQTSLLVSYEISRFTPYLGTRWSRVDYIHWTGEDRKRITSDASKGVGLITGCSYSVTKNIWVNVEGEFFDSNALACSVNYNF